jgi:hypothetical protein
VFTIFGTATLLYGIFFDRTVFNAYLEAVHLLDAVRRMVPYRNKIPPETELPSDHAYDDTHIATPTAQHDAQHDARRICSTMHGARYRKLRTRCQYLPYTLLRSPSFLLPRKRTSNTFE